VVAVLRFHLQGQSPGAGDNATMMRPTEDLGMSENCPPGESVMYEDEMDDDEIVADCGTPGCLMPGLHFRSECHTIEMVEDCERENDQIPPFINGTPRPWA